MGYNTAVVLYNDQTERWPREISAAMRSWVRYDLRRASWDTDGNFGWGRVISTAHADESQVCVVGQNWGRYITPIGPAQQPADLNVLSEILRAHGFSVKHPGEKRARPPLLWGYAAVREDA